MAHDIILKKLLQIDGLLTELKRLLALPFETFVGNLDSIRSAERNFELLIEVASDVNNEIILERNLATADTYRGSFVRLENAGIINPDLANALVEGARIRNILVHEYDFEEDYKKFYDSAKLILPAYHDYVRTIRDYLAASAPTEAQ